MIYHATPLRTLLEEADLPLDFITSSNSPIGDLLDKLYFADYDLLSSPDMFGVSIELVVDGEIAIELAGITGLAVVFLSDGSGATVVDVGLAITDKGLNARLNQVAVALRFPPDILRPMPPTSGATAPPFAQIGVSGSITMNENFDITFEGFNALDLPRAMIGDSGLVISIEDLGFDFSRTEALPEVLAAGFDETFVGVFVRAATVSYEREGSAVAPQLTLSRGAIGSGGFNGDISLGLLPVRMDGSSTALSVDDQQALETLRDETPSPDGHEVTLDGRPINLYVVSLEGMHVALEYFGVGFRQSIPVSSRIAGYVYMPFAEKWFRLEASIGGPDGDFMLELGGAGDAGLVSLDTDLFEIIADSIRYELRDDVHYAVVNGSVRPKLGDFDWPTFKVDRLAIGSNGDIDLDGGWVDMPETFTLDFHGFKVDISQIGMGSEVETARQWFGFSGGIRLIEGIPLSASVQGLKISWNTSGDPGIQVSLEGIAVHLEIPNTLVLDGAVRYQEIAPPQEPSGDTTDGSADMAASPATSSGVFGHVFTGSVSLKLITLNTQVSGELLIGDLTRYHYNESGELQIGEKFTAFYIVLSAELPTALPLGATGTGLYGLQGLFGMHVAPDRQLTASGEPKSWYLWYKEPKPGVEGSEYSVTKVQKVAPRFDNWACGAGIGLGTIYDDGFTITFGALVVILIPGPVVMIEGRANLLKQRAKGGGGKDAEGTLYALIVFDGLAETFQMNVDINYSLEDVITVGGGMEAFFDFNDDTKWYIYIGKKEPENKRIRAEILSIISASAYFMVDPTAIQFGAAVGINLDLEYGPVEIRLIIRLRFEIALFFKEPQLTGLIELYGEITIKIFGIGLSLILQALLEGSAPQPWWIHGLARFALSLPFPLPSIDAQVEFTWGESSEPARVELLKSAAMVHPKELGASWEMPATSEGAPVVPIDALPVVSCGKPISQLSVYRDEAGGHKYFDQEIVEGFEFRYDILGFTLYLGDTDQVAHSRDSPPPAEPGARATEPWLQGGRLLPIPNDGVQEPQVQLWGYSPLDLVHPIARESYVDLCDFVQPSSQTHCVHWRNIAPGTAYPALFSHQGFGFAVAVGTAPAIVKDASPVIRGLEVRGLSMRLPEPVVQIKIAYATGSPSFASYYQGSEVPGTWTRAVGDGVQVETLSETRIDSIRLRLPTRDILSAQPPVLITEICYITARELNVALPSSGPEGENRAGMSEVALLLPDMTYKLVVKAQRRERVVGEEEFRPPIEQSATYYFKTAKAPGLNLSTPEIEAIDQRLANGEWSEEQLELAEETKRQALKVNFRDGAINRLDTYVARTVPRDGAKLFYLDYDVLIEFNEPYVPGVYGETLKIRMKDRNGKPLRGSGSDTTLIPRRVGSRMPLLTSGLLAYQSSPRQAECAGSPKPGPTFEKQYLASALPEAARPGRMYSVELMVEEKVLYQFEFATSRYRNIREHLESGFIEGGDAADEASPPRTIQQVRMGLPPLPPGDAGEPALPPLEWFSEYDRSLGAFELARERLVEAVQMPEDAVVTAEQGLADMAKASDDLHLFCATRYAALDEHVHPNFTAIGLDHRPLPPVVELVRIGTDGEAGYFLLLETPEPIEWARIKLRYSIGGGTDQAARIVWSEDQTRAFIFPSNGLFSGERYDFAFAYHRGGASAPDLDPLFLNGSIDPPVEEVRWAIEVTADVVL